MLSVTLLARFTQFTSAMIWGQIKVGLPGLLIQALLIKLKHLLGSVNCHIPQPFGG